MADQPARLEAATIKAEIGSGIVYRFSNDAASEADIPTLSGAIPNLKNVILRIQNEGAEKISFATKIFIDTAAGIAGTSNQEIFLVQSAEPGEIYEVWQNVSGTAVDTGKRSISADAVIAATEAATAAAASAQESADLATTRVARFLDPATSLPTTRDDGQPLQAGDRILLEPSNVEYIYTSTGWESNDLSGTTDFGRDLISAENAVAAREVIGLGEVDNTSDADKPISTAQAAVNLTKVSYVGNYAALRAHTGSSTSVHVTGRANIFDGGGGSFSVIPGDSTTADNDITIIVDALGRRFMREKSGSVNIRWAGAACDGVTDDTAAVQKAVNYCKTFIRWPSMEVPGRTRLASSVIVDRPVDSTPSEWRVFGTGEGAGFYATGNVTFFDSSLASTTDPASEWVCFENLQFESSSIFNMAYVISQKFLRIKNINCNYRLIRYVTSTIYIQTHYFISHNLRNTPTPFIDCGGCYDISFAHGVIENCNTTLRSISTTRGTVGVRFLDNVIEGMQSSTVVCTGAAAFSFAFNHLEGNQANDLNFFAGSMMNQSISILSNYVINPNGALAYYGPTVRVDSSGNYASGALHSNVSAVQYLSANDTATPVSDAPLATKVGGMVTNGQVSLSTPLGAPQEGNIFMGSGAPGGAAGKDGDVYIRTDSPTGTKTTLYVHASGTWVAVV